MSPENMHYLRCSEALKNSIIFNNLESNEIHNLLSHMTMTKWKKGIFMNSSEFNSSLHFIISGRIKGFQINVNTKREHTVFILTKGDLFDIINLMDGKNHLMYWETLDDLELLIIPILEMRRWVEENSRLNRSLMSY